MNELPSFGIGQNGQTFFRWDEPDQNRRHHVFFAVLVEKPINALLAKKRVSFRRELGLRGTLIPESHIHITLVGLGYHQRRPAGLIGVARHIGSLIQARPFEVSLDRLSAFGGGALVLRSSDSSPVLQAFWCNLSAVIDDSPLKPFVSKSIEPHVTLLRDRQRVPKVRERALNQSGGLCGILH
ncbi:2'-5' RNA ligase family protein [Mesorhizobium sp.]|uniref:2'-5' RNA ligase family protein n=1 Tax=Mesorhizobium sp. TaxID=1871066 RepID=UPI0025BA5315|nr:2'-5' RNA ligase family protein [Mesorhizobium sp.]